MATISRWSDGDPECCIVRGCCLGTLVCLALCVNAHSTGDIIVVVLKGTPREDREHVSGVDMDVLFWRGKLGCGNAVFGGKIKLTGGGSNVVVGLDVVN